jgi:type III pantothenate kinase
MVSLILDIGNTAVKAGCFDGRKLLKAGRALRSNESEMEDLLVKMQLHLPGRAFIGNVVHGEEFIEKFLDRARISYTYFKPDVATKVLNRYESPETLGRDRLANAEAAAHLFPGSPVVIIDAGTCIKFDFVTSENEYFGGSISPGIDMRFKALHDYTARLPLLNRSETIFLIGKNTTEAIQSGVINGALAEVKGVLEQYQMTHKDLRVIVTGGDIALLERNLKTTIYAEPWLTLKGLNEISLQHPA